MRKHSNRKIIQKAVKLLTAFFNALKEKLLKISAFLLFLPTKPYQS